MGKPLVRVAWESFGKGWDHPKVDTLPQKHEGTRCICCLVVILVNTPALWARNIMSEKFTEWDHLIPGDWLCAPCAWAFNDSANRMRRFFVMGDSVTVLDGDAGAVVDLLVNDLARVRQEGTFVVPVGGRKHVLPYAEQGGVNSEYGFLSLNELFVQQLVAVSFLSNVGVGETHIKDRVFSLPVSELGLLQLTLMAWGSIRDVPESSMVPLLTLSRVLGRGHLGEFHPYLFEG